ncbi:hypothetical protein [Streptomyces sp. NPDC047070]|uniref:hypothetical protein n=1 Tax=Streptomyces sp. NPDC047070 TaxID=3154923 RepID=UPI003455BBE9
MNSSRPGAALRRPFAGKGRGSDKISPWFRDLMDAMSSEDIETALTVGTAYLVASEAQRNGTAPPRSLDHVMRTARDLFAELNSLTPTPRGLDSIGVFGPRGDLFLVEAKSSRPLPGTPFALPRAGKVPHGATAAWEAKSDRRAGGARAG